MPVSLKKVTPGNESLMVTALPPQGFKFVLQPHVNIICENSEIIFFLDTFIREKIISFLNRIIFAVFHTRRNV